MVRAAGIFCQQKSADTVIQNKGVARKSRDYAHVSIAAALGIVE